jgi:uncharacterized protein YecT (DUF1311 family)
LLIVNSIGKYLFLSVRRRNKPLFFCILAVATLKAMASESSQTCLEHADTQLAINQCSSRNKQTADQELNDVYQAVLKQHADDKTFTDNLKQAQRAWLKWRDAEMAAIYPERKQPGYYGSSFAGCWSEQLATLTRERTRQLRKWLDGVEEGDVCAGSLPVKTAIQ